MAAAALADPAMDDNGDDKQPIAEPDDDVIIQLLSRQPERTLDTMQPTTTTKMPEVQVRTGDVVTRIAPSVKLPKFDGRGSVELFVKRFQNIATFYHWTEAKRLFLLQSHLEGPVERWLWEQKVTIEKQIVEALMVRYGVDMLPAHYKNELQKRRRIPKESLPALMEDIRDLLSRAYPSSSMQTLEEIGLYQFVAAIDRQLRIRVIDKKNRKRWMRLYAWQ